MPPGAAGVAAGEGPVCGMGWFMGMFMSILCSGDGEACGDGDGEDDGVCIPGILFMSVC